MNDLRFPFRQLVKNVAVVVLTLAPAIPTRQQSWYAPQPFAEPPSGLGLASLGIEQTHSHHLPRVYQVPMNANPNHKEFCSRLGRNSKVFRMSDRQCLAVGEMQLEGAEWGSIAHFLKVHDFHIRELIVNQFIQVFK